MDKKEKELFLSYIKNIKTSRVHDKDSSTPAPSPSKNKPQQSGSSEKTIDLHGMKKAEAENMLLHELAFCKTSGIRTLHVIHGKGINSDPNKGAVLKEMVKAVLKKELGHLIRDYHSAPPRSGGDGATIVKL